MKVAVIFKGSSINTYNHWQFKDLVKVNYKHNLDNIKENLLDPNNCDVFFHTWKSDNHELEEYEQLAVDIGAKSFVIEEDIPGSHGPELGKKVITTTKKAIDCFRDYKNKTKTAYDLIVVCRFDLFFFHSVQIDKIAATDFKNNAVFVYALGPNINNEIIDKEGTKDIGIDDNLIIFTPNALDDYYDCLDKKTETIATYRNPDFFNPLQHPSLHHLYYLLNKKIDVVNLVHILSYTDKTNLFGIIKEVHAESELIERCCPTKKIKIDNDLFVIKYE